MMHRGVFSLIIGRLALATLLVVVGAAETFGQLDERWAVTINGQTVQVESDGSFLLSNVSAPDVFGPGGPGTIPDFLSDDVYRLTGVRTTGSGTLYVYSPDAVRILPNDRFTFSLGSLQVTSFAPPLPESLALRVDCAAPQAPKLCGSLITPIGSDGQCPNTVPCSVPLLTMGTVSDGMQDNVTLPSKRTTYRTSNVNIARVVQNNATTPATMWVEGVSPGTAFITATNGGATSVVKITVGNPSDLISTTIEGFVRNPENMPVVGAAVTVRMDDGSQVIRCLNCTGADGSFSISPVMLLNTTPGIFAEAEVGGSTTELGSSAQVALVPGGITDVGIITIGIVCDTPWSAAFGPTVFELVNPDGNESSLEINAFAVFNDGAGPALYAAGLFNRAGGVPANDIARWNGRSWEPVGAGITPGANGSLRSIDAMAVVDLGDGPALYVVGSFVAAGGISAMHVAKWDGQNWSALGGGVGLADNNSASAVAGFDDGSGGGMELYVGGFFAEASGVGAYSIAKWDRTTQAWSAVGVGDQPGINTGPVNALAVFDGGSGPELYAGGDFFSSSQVPSPNIVKWNGTSWLAVGSGLGKINSLTVFDTGTGPALYAGGNFFGATGDFVSRWDGTAWTALGPGLSSGEVKALVGLTDGSGPFLYAAGSFTRIGSSAGPFARKIARWNGSAWSALGEGLETSGQALAVFDDGSGLALYTAGRVCVSGCPGALTARSSELDSKQRNRPGSPHRLSVSTDAAAAVAVYQGYVARWKMDEWSLPSNGLNDEVRALTVFDDDGLGTSPPALYAGGRFRPPLGPRDDNDAPFPTNAVARFDGEKWSSLGTGLTNYDTDLLPTAAKVHALAVFDEDGTNPNPPLLFAGGDFAFAGGMTANNMARWDGADWTAVGTVGGVVEALAIFDDGTGSHLYAGGMFSGGVKMWDGTAWTTPGGGVTGSVFAEAVFNGELYIGGSFSDAGGPGGPANLARWDGSTWSAVGSGATDSVYALTVFDDGTGPALYAGGEFLLPVAGGITANRVAKWDGVAWSALSDGLGPTSISAIRVDTLFGFDSGSGPFLYAGGDFLTVGGSVDQNGACVPDTGCIPTNRLAKWNPVLDEWSAVGVSSQAGSDPGGGVDGAGTVAVQALAVFDDGTNGPALFAGGAFETAAGAPSSNIAKLGCR